jgi:hypothetical protein
MVPPHLYPLFPSILFGTDLVRRANRIPSLSTGEGVRG